MTEKEFAKIGIGDIVSHGSVPWGIWVVVSNDLNGGWHCVRIIDNSNVGPIEHSRMETPAEWKLLSKVMKRKKYDANAA